MVSFWGLRIPLAPALLNSRPSRVALCQEVTWWVVNLGCDWLQPVHR